METLIIIAALLTGPFGIAFAADAFLNRPTPAVKAARNWAATSVADRLDDYDRF